MPKSMLLSAAERARKDVGEWWSLHAQNKCGIGGGYEDLIARLTPVYERAQASPYGWGVDHWRKLAQERGVERDALRDWAERAEAELVSLQRTHKIICTGYDNFRNKADAAEADVKRLRAYVQHRGDCLAERDLALDRNPLALLPCVCGLRKALAATERISVDSPCAMGRAVRIDAAITDHCLEHAQMLAQTRAEEREACARVAEESEHEDGVDCNWHCNAPIAAAIRARKEPGR